MQDASISARLRLTIILSLVVLSGCQYAGSAGRRIGEDSFVVATSPVQIPVMAVRDAATLYEHPGACAAMFPITFPLYVLEHAIFTTVHALDLLVFPAHFFHDSESLRIYESYGLPLPRGTRASVFTDFLGGTMLGVAVIALPIVLAIASAATVAAL